MLGRVGTVLEMIKVLALGILSASGPLDGIESIENTGFRTL
jgi:hypothetical protein